MNKTFDDPDFSERVRSKEPAALQAVVRAYLRQVVNAARGAGFGPEAAEDVAQSTFVTFIEKAHRFEGRSHVRTWIFGILYRKVAEARRADRRTQPVDNIEELMQKRFDKKGSWVRPPRPLDAQIYAGEVHAAIDSCLELAPLKQRMAFVLREVEELGTGEICKIMDVSRTNLGVLLYRARNRLRDCLEARGISP